MASIICVQLRGWPASSRTLAAASSALSFLGLSPFWTAFLARGALVPLAGAAAAVDAAWAGGGPSAAPDVLVRAFRFDRGALASGAAVPSRTPLSSLRGVVVFLLAIMRLLH